MAYYNKSELCRISILEFSKQIERDQLIDLGQMVENDCHFVFYDADMFRQGVCQLFAYVLHRKFGYKVYIIKAEKGFHIFCKTLDGQYVDVRGMTHSFSEFIGGLELPDIKDDTSEPYSFCDNDFDGDYHNVALVFANELIEHDIQRYKT